MTSQPLCPALSSEPLRFNAIHLPVTRSRFIFGLDVWLVGGCSSSALLLLFEVISLLIPSLGSVLCTFPLGRIHLGVCLVPMS